MAKEKTRTHRLNMYRYWDIDALAWQLNDMAKKGWRFTGFDLGLVFEKADCSDDVYAVEIFSKGNEMDLRPAQKTKEFAAYCEAAGWELVDSQQKLCVFRRLREDAKPIFTTEETFRAVRRGLWEQILMLIIIPVLLIVQQTILYRQNPVDYVTEPLMMGMVAFVFLMFLYFGAFFLSGVQFLKSAGNMVKQGERPIYGVWANGQEQLKMHFSSIGWFALFILLGMLLMLALAGGSFWFIYGVLLIIVATGAIALLMYLRPKKGGYLLFTAVFIVIVSLLVGVFLFGFLSSDGSDSLSDMPLRLEDIGAMTTSDSTVDIYHSKTFLASQDSYAVHGDAYVDDLSISMTEEELKQYDSEYEWAVQKGYHWNNYDYTVYRSRYETILTKIWNEQIAPKEWQNTFQKASRAETEAWGARAMYKGNESPEYLLLYDNCVVSISVRDENGADPVDWNAKNIQTVKAKLQVDA